MRRLSVALLGIAIALATMAPAGAWEPGVRAAKRYARDRAGSVSFAIVDHHGHYAGHHGFAEVPSASVVKAMFLVAYLRRDQVRNRALDEEDRSLLSPMIRRSDNTAASRVADILGPSPMYRLADRSGMKHFRYTRPWGMSTITAGDQARFFFRLERYIPERHEGYSRYLLSHIVRSQRWGIATLDLEPWKLFFKGGWGSGTGEVDHQVAFLERPDGRRVAIAITTRDSPSHAYGNRTLAGVSRRLLRNLP